jgi:hypothetical protein
MAEEMNLWRTPSSHIIIMQLKAIELVQSVFAFLDGVIRDDGIFIFIGFVYLLIPFTIWALSGGLRRKLLKGKPMPHVPPVVVIHLPGSPPRPPETFDPLPKEAALAAEVGRTRELLERQVEQRRMARGR